MSPRKLVLCVVDSLRTDKLLEAVGQGLAPTFGALVERGTLIGDCVSSFPSVTPVCNSEIVTGVRPDRHRISGSNWYSAVERRYIEYGSSFEATRAFGLFRTLYDIVYNMNMSHLSPEVETVFERLGDRGLRSACTPFLIYRGRSRHELGLEGLLRRVALAANFRHAIWGPDELFYGELYASRALDCRPTLARPGTRDEYSACVGRELVREDLYDFLLFSLPDNDYHSHQLGPEAQVESIARADGALAEIVDAAGGLERFLASQRRDPDRRPRADQGRAPARPDRGASLPVGDARAQRAAGPRRARGQPDRPRRGRLRARPRSPRRTGARRGPRAARGHGRGGPVRLAGLGRWAVVQRAGCVAPVPAGDGAGRPARRRLGDRGRSRGARRRGGRGALRLRSLSGRARPAVGGAARAARGRHPGLGRRGLGAGGLGWGHPLPAAAATARSPPATRSARCCSAGWSPGPRPGASSGRSATSPGWSSSISAPRRRRDPTRPAALRSGRRVADRPASEQGIASPPAAGALARAADRSFAFLRRMHLATRKPANWLQLFKFALVGASGYVVNLVVFALLAEGAGVHHIPAAIGRLRRRGDQQLPARTGTGPSTPPTGTPAFRRRASSPSACSGSGSTSSSSSCSSRRPGSPSSRRRRSRSRSRCRSTSSATSCGRSAAAEARRRPRRRGRRPAGVRRGAGPRRRLLPRPGAARVPAAHPARMGRRRPSRGQGRRPRSRGDRAGGAARPARTSVVASDDGRGWQVGVQRRGDRGGTGDRRPVGARGPRVVDGRPGRVADGARLRRASSGTCSTPPTSGCRSAPCS